MKLTNNTWAIDFNAFTSERMPFTLSRLKGSKILLSFYRNGGCAWSNFRLNLLKKYKDEFIAKNVNVVSVFESMPKDILPFAGRSEPPFYMLADPMSLLYDLYSVEISEKKVRSAIASGITLRMIEEATKAGFVSELQESSNLFRLPADFLIDENFIIRQLRYTNNIVDFLPVREIIKWMHHLHFFPPQQNHFTEILQHEN